MPRLRNISGKECIKILCNSFGSHIIRQNGSHIILQRQTPEWSVGTVVPLHKEIKIGTLKSILELAKIEEEEFAKNI